MGASCVCVCVCVLVCLVCVCLVCVVRAQTLPSAGAGWLVVVVACSNWAKNSTLFSGIGKDNCFANICPNTPYTCVCKRNAGDQLTLLGEQRARSQVRSVGCVCVCALLTVCFALRSVWLRSVWFVCVVCALCVLFVGFCVCVCVCVCVRVLCAGVLVRACSIACSTWCWCWCCLRAECTAMHTVTTYVRPYDLPCRVWCGVFVFDGDGRPRLVHLRRRRRRHHHHHRHLRESLSVATQGGPSIARFLKT